MNQEDALAKAGRTLTEAIATGAIPIADEAALLAIAMATVTEKDLDRATKEYGSLGDRFAEALQEAGMGEGDRLLLIMHNEALPKPDTIPDTWEDFPVLFVAMPLPINPGGEF